MDLRSVLNTSDNGDRAAPKTQTTPQQQHQPRPAPSPAQYGYRDYAQPPPQPSPGKPMAQDYPHHPQQHPGAAYLPPSPYQGPGQYPPGRNAPANSFHDARSPGSVSGPLQSPYRPISTPTNAPGGSTAGYPFPPSQAPPQEMSPSQRHQYPPGHYQQQQLQAQQQQQLQAQQQQQIQAQQQQQIQAQQQQQLQAQQQQQLQAQQQRQRRDSYSKGAAGAYAQQQQQQQQHPVPQTPPVGTPGGSSSSHPYLHQRSQSTHSTPTPTSAHSQHQFGPPHVHGSPVVASRPPPPSAEAAGAEYTRQLSQPPTPLGPPLSAGSRPAAGHGGVPQPPSPYQPRLSAPGSAQSVQQQASLIHPPPSPAVQRMSSARSSYESPSSDAHRPRSHHEREQSLSVSPRTRVASLASTSERPSLAVSTETEKRPAPVMQTLAVDMDRAVTPAKRKLEDRSMSPRELENREVRPPPGEVNGGFVARAQKSESPAAPRKKRTFRPQPPVWAESARTLGNKMPNHANYVLSKRAHGPVQTNGGKPDSGIKTERSSRHPSPEAARAQPSGATNQAPAQAAPEPGPQDVLGAWEASITGVKPYEEISKTIADFIFIHVVNNPDFKEIISRGIQFEIEAKLGTLIDKDTNCRVDRLLDTECVLHDNGRVAFRSSMTEAHHKAFNDFLNQIVIQTDPRAPNNGVARVQVHYKHRREIDRFFDLPPDLQTRLPGCMRSRLGIRGRNVRARVTYDQKTREVLNTIVKARVADIDVHMPASPMDCRLSINLEMAWEGPVEELEQVAGHTDKQPDRNKDRLSYTQGHYQIDLTQVTQTLSGPGNSQRLEKEHELEIELASAIVIDQGAKAMSGGVHRYQELVEGLLDNVRVLTRKAREFS